MSRRLSPRRADPHAATELHMLEIEVVEQDARTASSFLLAKKQEPNFDHRQCMASGFVDHYPIVKHNKNKNNTPPTRSPMLGSGMIGAKGGGVGESSGISSCNTSVTRSTADVTSSSCDSSLTRDVEPQQFIVWEESLEISAVDTHTSILNITEDDDDDDEEEDDQEADDQQQQQEQLERDEDEPLIDACQFEEAHPESEFAPAQCPSDPSLTTGEEGRCIQAGKTGLSFMENIVEGFVENLCFSNKEADQQHEAGHAFHASRQPQDVLEKIESDMTTILGCLGPDSVTEMKHAQRMLSHLLCNHASSASDESTQPPRRNTKRQRMRRLQKLQEERGRDGLNVYAVRSMQELSSCRSNLDDSGYDSDPDDVLLVSSSHFNKMKERSPSPSSVTSLHHNEIPQDWQENLHPIVQESLNSVWDLTWHQPSSSSSSSTTATSTPVRVTAWMERGTIIKNNSVMIEPRLMWKVSSSSSLPSTPVSVQLMHICRVLPATGHLDRLQHPLARPSTSFIVRTTTRDRFQTRDYIFQAATAAERDALVHRWKVTVARFATLAVLEDAETLLKEFFVTASAFPAPLRRSSVC